jgi:hypothetical protein
MGDEDHIDHSWLLGDLSTFKFQTRSHLCPPASRSSKPTTASIVQTWSETAASIARVAMRPRTLAKSVTAPAVCMGARKASVVFHNWLDIFSGEFPRKMCKNG